MPAYDVKMIRKEFAELTQFMQKKPLVYLDSAATTLKPKRMVETLKKFYLEEYATVHRGVYQISQKATDRYHETRKAIQEFIQAKSPDEIIFTRGTTDSINLVAYSFGEICLSKGDEILISQSEHHSNLVPWQMLCQRKGAFLKMIPIHEKGEIKFEEFEKLLNSKTKIVAIAHIANSTGTQHPIEKMIKKAHEYKAKVVIDGAQSIAHLPINVQQLDADFYAFSSHKLYGPNGVGVLYGKKELLEKMPPVQGGGDMIDWVTFEKTTYQPPPQRFEAGTPTIAEVIAFKDSLEFVKTLGMENILIHEKALLQKLTLEMEKIPGIRMIGQAKEKGAILSFVVENEHPLDIGTFLDLEGIAVRTGHHCAQPTMEFFKIPGTVRVSFGVYNTPEEVDFFVASLKKVMQKLH